MGCLGIIDLQTGIKVKQIGWVIKILKTNTNNRWKILPRSYFSCLDKYFEIELFALRTTDTCDQIYKKDIPRFHKDCILCFQELSRKANVFKNSTPVIIWCNHQLQFNG